MALRSVRVGEATLAALLRTLLPPLADSLVLKEFRGKAQRRTLHHVKIVQRSGS